MGRPHLRGSIGAVLSTLPPLALAATWEGAVGFPLPLPVYAAYGGLTLAMLALIWRSARRIAVLAAALIAGLVVLYAVPWTTRKAFLLDLHRIEVGMTEIQADTIMYPYIRGSGWPACPLPVPCSPVKGEPAPRHGVNGFMLPAAPTGKQRIYRHSDSRFDSDWGIVLLNDGRVVSVEFSGD